MLPQSRQSPLKFGRQRRFQVQDRPAPRVAQAQTMRVQRLPSEQQFVLCSVETGNQVG